MACIVMLPILITLYHISSLERGGRGFIQRQCQVVDASLEREKHAAPPRGTLPREALLPANLANGWNTGRDSRMKTEDGAVA
jgi:hypothetical protein